MKQAELRMTPVMTCVIVFVAATADAQTITVQQPVVQHFGVNTASERAGSRRGAAGGRLVGAVVECITSPELAVVTTVSRVDEQHGQRARVHPRLRRNGPDGSTGGRCAAFLYWESTGSAGSGRFRERQFVKHGRPRVAEPRNARCDQR